MKLKCLVVIFLLAGWLAGAGCIAPQTKQVIINSEPQGAKIFIDGENVGETPMHADLKFRNTKKDRHNIQIRKSGYEPEQRYHYYRDAPNILFQLEKASP